jgi:hypothetical protein
MADESEFKILQNDGTTKHVRNLRTTRGVVDGVPTADGDENRYMQVVALTDDDGRLLAPARGWREDMLDAQRETNELLTLILERLR